ncbi:hypothetical protein LINGRAHAP2_LOCUS34767, partial [Linum grandiflorum]
MSEGKSNPPLNGVLELSGPVLTSWKSYGTRLLLPCFTENQLRPPLVTPATFNS